MLGIGFIITHFVAMQKPQQRKYHSSCNRSVHRGTAHGKQRVKVCKRKTPHLFWCGVFCPLTGMVLGGLLIASLYTSFRPLTGMVPMKHSAIRKRGRFRPLTGMVLQSPQTSRTQWSYRPLAGMVCIKCSMTLASCGFRPLTGMGYYV